MPSLFRCAHISDLHFAKPSWRPSQFFSKRWLGNLNLLLSRKRDYAAENLYSLVNTFLQLNIDHVFITGDFTTTSSKEEFSLAREFVSALKKARLNVFTLPGNHDQYTYAAHRNQLFYQFFDSSFGQGDHPAYSFNLKKNGCAPAQLSANWWVILLDTAIATPLISSCGLFSSDREKHLEDLLALIPTDHSVIVANHFPFFQNDVRRKILKGGPALRNLIERHPNIRFYLHGHTHRHCIADLRSSGLPIILDSGSTAHNRIGSWNLIDIADEGCTIEPFYWKQDASAVNNGTWAPKAEHTFKW